MARKTYPSASAKQNELRARSSDENGSSGAALPSYGAQTDGRQIPRDNEHSIARLKYGTLQNYLMVCETALTGSSRTLLGDG
jgi:hypothetical protein